MCLKILSHEEMAVETDQREAVGWGMQPACGNLLSPDCQENKCDGNTDFLERVVTKQHCGWAVERVTNEMLLDPPFILFLKHLPILEQPQSAEAPFTMQSPI